MSAFLCIIICVYGLPAANFSQSQGWRGIVPLHSTREDVERLIGPPMTPNGTTYALKDERVNVVYSDGGCAKGRPAEWNVPADTVIGIIIYPQVKLSPSDLHFDLNGFEKSINPHDPNSIYYKNKKDGVGVATGANKEVVAIEYLPAAKDDSLRCPHASQSSLDALKFDEYSDIPFSDEKARLDNLAARLRQYPDLMGYVIAYAGRRGRPGEARARADRAKDYLVNELGVEPRRVVAIAGGHREERMVDLYVLPQGAPPPAATPTVNPSEVQLIKKGRARINNNRPLRPRRKLRRLHQ